VDGLEALQGYSGGQPTFESDRLEGSTHRHNRLEEESEKKQEQDSEVRNSFAVLLPLRSARSALGIAPNAAATYP